MDEAPSPADDARQGEDHLHRDDEEARRLGVLGRAAIQLVEAQGREPLVFRRFGLPVTPDVAGVDAEE